MEKVYMPIFYKKFMGGEKLEILSHEMGRKPPSALQLISEWAAEALSDEEYVEFMRRAIPKMCSYIPSGY